MKQVQDVYRTHPLPHLDDISWGQFKSGDKIQKEDHKLEECGFVICFQNSKHIPYKKKKKKKSNKFR